MPVADASSVVNEMLLYLQYLGSPFLCHPHKPIACSVAGSAYSRAYRHFRSAHSVPLNLAIHVVGLFYAALANAALLRCLDTYLFASGGGLLFNFLPLKHYHQHACSYLPTFACVSSDSALSSSSSPALLTIITLVSWIIFLLVLSRPCPRPIPILASLIILLCFGVAPASVEHWHALVWGEAGITAVLLRGGDAKAIPAWPWMPLAPLLITRLLIQFYIMSISPLSPQVVTTISVAFIAASALGSYKPFANPFSCYWAGYTGWVVALLTQSPSFFFYGSGFAASLLQGVAHKATGEMANLPELASRTGSERAADEMAHTTFFPCLVLHSAHESMFGSADSLYRG